MMNGWRNIINDDDDDDVWFKIDELQWMMDNGRWYMMNEKRSMNNYEYWITSD